MTASEHYATVRRILAGSKPPEAPLSAGARKMLHLLLGHEEGCDVELADRAAWIVRYGWHPSRHRYKYDLAPEVVAEILRRARVHVVIAPLVARLPSRPNSSEEPAHGDRLIWFRPEADRVTLMIRRGPSDAVPDVPVPVPETGELAFPSPIEFEIRWADFADGLTCPHCLRKATRYRELESAVVCKQCGRSFTPGSRSDALTLWNAGKPLQAGSIIYDHLPVEERPKWAAGVLEAACARILAPPAVRHVLELASHRERWRNAHNAFQGVRHLTLESERHPEQGDNTRRALLYLAENVAKVIYNASGEPAPFDHNAGWWVASCMSRLVDVVDDPAFAMEAMKALFPG